MVRRVTGRMKRVALVDPANPARTLGLARRGYLQEIAYDEANRVVTESTGVTTTGLQGAGGASTVTSIWDRRGAVSAVTSSYGELVTRVSRDEQGRVTEIAYADAARTWGRNGLAEWTKTRAHSLALHDEGRANHAPQALPVHSNPKGY